MRSSGELTLLSLLVFACCCPTVAVAQTTNEVPDKAAPAAAATPAPTPRRQASVLYKAGNQAAQVGMRKTSEGKRLLELALSKLQEAGKLYSSFKIDLNIGGVLAAMGRRTESAKFHEMFLIKMPRTVPAAIVTQAQKKLAELRMELGSVKLNCALEGVQVQINGEDVATTPQQIPWYVEPGKYVMILSKEGYVTDTRRLTLKKGDHRTIEVKLTSEAEVRRRQQQRDQLVRRKDRKKVIGYSALAAGAALAVGAAALYGVGASKGNEAFDGYSSTASKQEQERYREQVESAEGLVIGGHVLIGLAAAALGVSLWQLVSAARMEDRAPAPGQPGIEAAMLPTPGGAAFSLSGRF